MFDKAKITPGPGHVQPTDEQAQLMRENAELQEQMAALLRKASDLPGANREAAETARWMFLQASLMVGVVVYNTQTPWVGLWGDDTDS